VKRILLGILVVLGAVAFLISAGGASNGPSGKTYKIELDNAFGLVTGAAFKVAGVPAGSIQSINLDQRTLHAVVTVSVTQKGFGDFHADAFCQSRPQSLIGEYFIDCDPGTSGAVLKPGSTIPVTHTQSTIPADLLTDVMRLPYRERFSLIINELGAAVAGRPQDLQAALQRAVPALTETDNLLNLLANDSSTIQRLTADSNSVITSLANNSKLVQNWIVEAGRNAADTNTQRTALQATFHKLPTLLEALKPNMQALGETADANVPTLQNLQLASGQLTRLFADLPGFANSSKPSLKSLGQASVTGRTAVIAATPTIRDLNRFARPTPELAQNLAIVLPDLDNRNRSVETDPRSPGGKGYTGLEALLQYVYNQALAINTFSSFGHLLTVDGFYNQVCSPYATPQSIANNLKEYAAGQINIDPRSCFGWIGPNQPGINETDPSAPSACVPIPGGYPTNPGNVEKGYRGPSTTACQLAASSSPAAAADKSRRRAAEKSRRRTATTSTTSTTTTAAPSRSASGSGGKGSGAGGLGQALGDILGAFGGGAKAGPSGGSNGVPPALTSAASSAGSSSTSSSGAQTQQLLNYLLAP
jgi:virulence factor Mce-like protein